MGDVVFYSGNHLLKAVLDFQKDFVFDGEIQLIIKRGKIVGFSQELGIFNYHLCCENIDTENGFQIVDFGISFEDPIKAEEIIGVIELVLRPIYRSGLIQEEKKEGLPPNERKVIWRINK